MQRPLAIETARPERPLRGSTRRGQGWGAGRQRREVSDGVDAERLQPHDVFGDVDPALAVFDLRDIRLGLLEAGAELGLPDPSVLAGGDHQLDQPDINRVINRAPGAGSSGERTSHRAWR